MRIHTPHRHVRLGFGLTMHVLSAFFKECRDRMEGKEKNQLLQKALEKNTVVSVVLISMS